MQHKWGLSFDINTEPGPAGRSPGSLCWAGLFNTYFSIDPNKRVTGTIMTQLLPFADAEVLKLYAQFESGPVRGAEGGLIRPALGDRTDLGPDHGGRRRCRPPADEHSDAAPTGEWPTSAGL